MVHQHSTDDIYMKRFKLNGEYQSYETEVGMSVNCLVWMWTAWYDCEVMVPFNRLLRRTNVGFALPPGEAGSTSRNYVQCFYRNTGNARGNELHKNYHNSSISCIDSDVKFPVNAYEKQQEDA